MSRLTTFVISFGLLVGLVIQIPEQQYTTSGLDPRLNHIAVIGDSYTTGTNEGGLGPKGWTTLAWQALASRGVLVTADVVAEGGAGYVVRGNRGSIFHDLTARAVQPDDSLIVFFGSRNDMDADPAALARMSRDALALAGRIAPAAKLLVIGPPWINADVPPNMYRTRDILRDAARDVGAEFFDPIQAGWFFDRPELIGGDRIHPTDAGHAYMADKIAPLIGQELPRWV
ncbi:SGNH/GDSL hydrolase family protein [Mycobacterium sp. 21AC1]|uniref:Rv0518 family GDSL lipase n=1 Tax=[Mycobacterium] appelbergii TaxID=2939269 RepID=UPI002938EC61|nr:GDSL lipase [Mycobacterium sp. 21AC1]MDV3126392.1 SGNH/GDSL hydrolase family protein [Mycobacterium sp. 21AC1]